MVREHLNFLQTARYGFNIGIPSPYNELWYCSLLYLYLMSLCSLCLNWFNGLVWYDLNFGIEMIGLSYLILFRLCRSDQCHVIVRVIYICLASVTHILSVWILLMNGTLMFFRLRFWFYIPLWFVFLSSSSASETPVATLPPTPRARLVCFSSGSRLDCQSYSQHIAINPNSIMTSKVTVEGHVDEGW